ncbi:MAG: hypothetical protein AAGB51_05350 [Planctomycetota bacterium]
MTRIPNQPGADGRRPAEASAPEATDTETRQPIRVLLVGGDRTRRARVRGALGRFDAQIISSRTFDDARQKAGDRDLDVALVLGGEELLMPLNSADPSLTLVIVASEPTTAETIAAMRCGASDVIADNATIAEFASRLNVAAQRTMSERQREARASELQGLCRKLNNAREEVTRHVGSLCDDLVEAYQDLTDQIGRVSTASEFGSLARQQLDVEELLRTTLEYTLAKVGSTNAAIFLPASTGEFTLGAYVNYDCPRDAAEMVLDQLAEVVPQHFEEREGLCVLNGAHTVELAFGDDAHWFDDRAVAVYSCHEGGECIAVVCLFRNAEQPFEEDHSETMAVVGDLFSAQLNRVIHVHHRHLPEDDWGEGFGDIDLAA